MGADYGVRISWDGVRRIAVVGGGVAGAGLCGAAWWLTGTVATASADVSPGAGTATHYHSTDGGNCSFVGPPADHLDVALSETEYGTVDACGGYLDVKGPNGTVRVEVTNRCPECPVHHLDLSETAFARIAPLAAGQVDVTYSLVRNPPLADPIALRVKSGSSRWWLQIQASNTGNPLERFELRTSSGWRQLVHTQDNFWMAENPGPGDGPFTVRITDIFGQSATIDGVALAPDQVQRTSARLYGPGAGSGAAAPPPASPATSTPSTTAAAPTSTAPATTSSIVATTRVEPATTTARHIAASKPTVEASEGDTGPGVASTLLGVVTFAVLGLTALALRRRDSGELPATPEAADTAPASDPVDVIVRAIRDGAPR